MNINPNLSKSAHLAVADFQWHPSPLTGVDRVLLDRVGDEVAVATSIVRYAPQAYFDPHAHALGEEFIVLEGIFSDEHADYPAGTYVRNPPGTSHRPHSKPGCVIWVKLRQFADLDQTPLVTTLWRAEELSTSEVSVQEVFRYQDEVVTLVNVPAGQRFAFDACYYVRELLVLRGALTWQQETTRTFSPWSWIRMDPGQPLRVNTLSDCLLFSKTRPVYRQPK